MSRADLHVVRDDEYVSISKAPEGADTALRPACFDDYIGQTEVVENLRGAIRAARRGGWQLDHMLLAGGAGYGKTTLCQIIAAELGVKLHATSAPAIEHKGALASLLTTLEDGDVLFIDELHALDRKLAETTYSALEDRVLDMSVGKRVIRVPLPKFTLLGATTHAGKLPKPLLDRFGFVWQLRSYTLPEMQLIVTRAAQKLGVTIDDEGALAIAHASRGTPRIANRLLRRVRDYVVGADVPRGLMQSRLVIGGPLATAALIQLGLDPLGLDSLDRRYLAVIAARPAGIEAICAELGEDRSTIEDAVEPFLLQIDAIRRTSRGRVLTVAGERLLEGNQP